MKMYTLKKKVYSKVPRKNFSRPENFKRSNNSKIQSTERFRKYFKTLFEIH